MIKRVYIHNYRCFENFDFELGDLHSALIIGENGSGKSTLRKALGIFQQIGRGQTRVRQLLEASDYTQERTRIPMRFELQCQLEGESFHYAISFELPENFHESRVAQEELSVGGESVFSRSLGDVTMGSDGAQFGLDWHVVGLPLINERRGKTWIQKLKSFLASMILIHPIPSQMSGYSERETHELEEDASNFSSWLATLLSRHPAAYSHLIDYLRAVMPDISVFENVPRGEKGKQLFVEFERDNSRLSVDFHRLSDGEKCFFLCALIVTSRKYSAPFFCMWDEPDNHLALPEVSHFVTELRKSTQRKGQFLATSHHPGTIRSFSDENTFHFHRRSHLEPTIYLKLEELSYRGDLIEALTLGELGR